MALQEIEFTSRNRRDAIQAWAYEPVGTPAAVVQIIHGLGEHSRRYLHMISALLDAGFVVIADDHAGHGRTQPDDGGPPPGTQAGEGGAARPGDEQQHGRGEHHAQGDHGGRADVVEQQARHGRAELLAQQ